MFNVLPLHGSYLTSSVSGRLGMFALFGSKSWLFPTSCNQRELNVALSAVQSLFKGCFFSCLHRLGCALVSEAHETTALPVMSLTLFRCFRSHSHVSFAFSYTVSCEFLVLKACTVSGDAVSESFMFLAKEWSCELQLTLFRE